MNFILNKHKHNNQDNIFYDFSKLYNDEETRSLNKQIIKIFKNTNYIFSKHHDNIIKKINNLENYYWENLVHIYLNLIETSFTLPIKSKQLNITYFTKNHISLYNYLNQEKISNMNVNYKFILNELFGFVNTFRKYKFLHGNLHIHNIFINPKQFIQKGKFYIIDFGNSYILESKSLIKNTYVDNQFFLYWDFFTLYISLKLYLKNNTELLIYIEELILNYIPKEILLEFLNYYNQQLTIHNFLGTPGYID